MREFLSDLGAEALNALEHSKTVDIGLHNVSHRPLPETFFSC